MFLLLTSLNCFSQTDISKKVDTTKVVISQTVAKQIAKDLIRLDGCTEELKLTQLKVEKLEEVIIFKDTIINLYMLKDKNWEYIIQEKDKQIQTYEELSKNLQKEIKRKRVESFFYKAGTVVFGIATTVLLITSF